MPPDDRANGAHAALLSADARPIDADQSATGPAALARAIITELTPIDVRARRA
jgi:hypothetical protein